MYCEIRNRVFGRNVENMFYILSHFSSRAMWTCRRKKYLQERIKIHKHRDIAEMEENRTPEASVSSFQASSTLITFYFLYTKYDELSHTLFYTHFSIFFFYPSNFSTFFTLFSAWRSGRKLKNIRDVRLCTEKTWSEVKKWSNIMTFVSKKKI